METAKAACSGAAGFKLPVLLRRRLPTKHRHGNVVGAAQIALHLRLQVGKRIEAQVVVEAFLWLLSTFPVCLDFFFVDSAF